MGVRGYVRGRSGSISQVEGGGRGREEEGNNKTVG